MRLLRLLFDCRKKKATLVVARDRFLKEFETSWPLICILLIERHGLVILEQEKWVKQQALLAFLRWKVIQQ